MRLSRWAGRGSAAILDQGVFAGGHLLMNILLARWMSASDYGRFAVVYSLVLLASAAHSGLVVEPVLVHGSGRYRRSLGSYMTVAVTMHWRLSGTLGGGLVMIGLGVRLVGSHELGAGIIVAGLMTPLMLFMWLMRKAVYTTGRIRLAILWGLVYTGLLLAGTWFLHATDRLTPATSFLPLGVAAILSGAGTIRSFRASIGQDELAADDDLRASAVRMGIGYGKWAAGAQALSWLTNSAFYVLVGGIVSVEAAGIMRAIMNLFLPIQHALVGLAGAFLPEMAKCFDAMGAEGVVREVRTVSILLAPVVLFYSLAMGLAGGWLLELAYAGQYRVAETWIPLFLPLPVLWAGVTVLENALRAVGRPNAVFYALGISGIVAMVTGIPLVAANGAKAAPIVWCGSLGVGVVTLLQAMRTIHSESRLASRT